MTKQPISERRLAANRANAQKSTGPRTPEGKRRVSRNASRHNLYAGFHRLPEDIEDLLYRKALEETADIADPRFRALFVHRLMLRGHERRLLQLEGKLWAEALRVNNGIVPYASLWIRENHAEVVQALGRYHAWICVRIRAIQKSIFPYIIGDVGNQTGISARTQALLASAAGSSRPILLAASTGTSLNPDHQPAFLGSWNPNPSGQSDNATSAHSAVSTIRNLPLAGGLSSLMTARGGFRPVRPVPAPQAVKAIRPPTVPGLSLRFLNRSRNPINSTRGKLPTTNHDRKGGLPALRTAHVSKRAPVAVASSTERATEAQSTLPEGSNPTPRAQSIPSPKPNSGATPIPVPKPKRRATAESLRENRTQQNPTPAALTQSTPHERTNPTQAARNPKSRSLSDGLPVQPELQTHSAPGTPGRAPPGP